VTLTVISIRAGSPRPCGLLVAVARIIHLMHLPRRHGVHNAAEQLTLSNKLRVEVGGDTQNMYLHAKTGLLHVS